MASKIESGHAKMISNFRTLINNITVFGNSYNPSNANIQLLQLESLLASVENHLADLIAANAIYKQKVVDKGNAFQDLKKLSTRIINTLQSSNVDVKTIENAKFFNRKIQGQRASNKPIALGEEETNIPRTISTSQLSASQLIQHLSGLISILETEPNYAPNEIDLQIPTLQAKRNSLLDSINAIDIAYANATNKRITRNNILYNNDICVHKSALEAKSYIKALFGVQSKEYKSISKLSFRKFKT